MPARRCLIITCLLFCFLAGWPQASLAQSVDPDLKSEIEKLIALQNPDDFAAQMGARFLPGILEGTKKLQPEVSEATLAIVRETLLELIKKDLTGTGTLRAAQIAMYAKHFTREDVATIIAFYQTEAGRKMVRVAPLVVQDIDQMQREWLSSNAANFSQVVQARMKAAGLPPFPK